MLIGQVQLYVITQLVYLSNIPTSGNFNLNGQLIVSDTTNSVNTSVGSIQTAGGIGITKVGGGATFGGHLIPSTNISDLQQIDGEIYILLTWVEH